MVHLAQKELELKIQTYVRSIETLDFDLARDLWLTTNQSTFIHPRGHEIGFDAIIQSFYLGTMGLFSERKLEAFNLTFHIQNQCAIVEFYWEFNARFKDTQEPHQTKGRESQVYLLTPSNEWELTHVHYSKMPVSGKQEGF